MKNRYFRIGGALTALAMIFCFAACPQPGGETPQVSSTPTANIVTVSKENVVQKTVTFVLTSTHTGAWKVYGAQSGGSPLPGVTATFSVPYLALTTDGTDLPARTYYVSVKESGKKESARLALIVNPSDNAPSMGDINKRIKQAEVALGDLSAVAADLSLPASDSNVTVNWSSSNAAVLSNTGTVNRQSAHATLTLTGTFASAADSSVSSQKIWNVRVMRTDAPASEFLVLDLQFENGELVNKAASGNYYEPALADTAAIQTQGGYDVIDLGSGGYIDLGPKVGSLLRKPQWTIEFYIYAQEDAGTLFSFANDNNISDTTNSPWRGTVTFAIPGLAFYAANNGRNGYSGGDGQRDTSAFVITGRSSGLAINSNSQLNRWTHVMICRDNNYIGIYRYGVHAQNDKGYSFARLTDDSTFDGTDDETWPLQYGYLGRSAFEGISSLSASEKAKIANGKFHGVKFYSRSLVTLNGSEVALDSDFITSRRDAASAMNTAFDYEQVP